MRKATLADRNLIKNILSASFDHNISVNFVVRQDRSRKMRIEKLMEYAFEVCLDFGDAYVSDDGKACALIVYPQSKRTTLRSTIRDLKFVLYCVSIFRIFKVWKRENEISRVYENKRSAHLWFIGVQPAEQYQGIGSQLLSEITTRYREERLPIYLETSAPENLPFYKKMGFEVYHEMQKPHRLFFLRRIWSQ